MQNICIKYFLFSTFLKHREKQTFISMKHKVKTNLKKTTCLFYLCFYYIIELKK